LNNTCVFIQVYCDRRHVISMIIEEKKKCKKATVNVNWCANVCSQLRSNFDRMQTCIRSSSSSRFFFLSSSCRRSFFSYLFYYWQQTATCLVVMILNVQLCLSLYLNCKNKEASENVIPIFLISIICGISFVYNQRLLFFHNA